MTSSGLIAIAAALCIALSTIAPAIGQGMNPNVYLNCNSPLQVTPTWRVTASVTTTCSRHSSAW